MEAPYSIDITRYQVSKQGSCEGITIKTTINHRGREERGEAQSTLERAVSTVGAIDNKNKDRHIVIEQCTRGPQCGQQKWRTRLRRRIDRETRGSPSKEN